jgi:hypothetical protein
MRVVAMPGLYVQEGRRAPFHISLRVKASSFRVCRCCCHTGGELPLPLRERVGVRGPLRVRYAITKRRLTRLASLGGSNLRSAPMRRINRKLNAGLRSRFRGPSSVGGGLTVLIEPFNRVAQSERKK